MRAKKRNSPYTQGELNKLIDSILHPLIANNPNLTILDTILHTIVEQNPTESTLKFLKYNLPEITKKPR